MNDIKEKVKELIEVIKNSDDYISYISLMKVVRDDDDIMKLIEEIKVYQKEIVKLNSINEDCSYYDGLIKENLDKLNRYPIYVEFSNLQDELNTSFQIIKDTLEKEINDITN